MPPARVSWTCFPLATLLRRPTSHFRRPLSCRSTTLPLKRLRVSSAPAGRSRLRHIDARLEWARALRDSNLVRVVHVSTHDNLSDLFTKALSVGAFTAMRNRMMTFHHIPV